MNKKIIDDIVFYIPFKKLRNAVREYLLEKLQLEYNKLSFLKDIQYKIDYYISNQRFGYFNKFTIKASEETYEYVSNVLKQYDVPFMLTQYHELEYILKNEKLIDGLFLEFGVYTGNTINLMFNILKDKIFYGFDSFEGLPENWNGTIRHKGSFDLQGNLPNVNDNVKLIKGWFDETLPKFLIEHKEPVSFIHVDSDLYSSAKTIFDNLKDRIVVGTIIVFDEYYNYNNWKNHEYKAFQEFVKENNIKYKYLTFGLETTCSVIITDIQN